MAILVSLSLLAFPAFTAGLEAGIGAYNAADYKTARTLLLPLAEQGDPVAEYLIGNLNHYGMGVSIDFAQAARWYERAASRENAEAMVELGLLHMRGDGVKKDYRRARELFESAARRGQPVGQFNLANMYINGLGVKKDYSAAAPWLQQAANRGHLMSAALLGFMYYAGSGITKDYDAAARFCGMSARAGNPVGMSCMAILYSQGHGTPKDYVQSYMWGTLALEKLPTEYARKAASRGLKMLKKWGISDEEIAQALELARNWRPVD